MSAAELRCPACEARADPAGPFAPFCTERCKQVDLYKWLNGDYQVPGLGDGDDEEDDATLGTTIVFEEDD